MRVPREELERHWVDRIPQIRSGWLHPANLIIVLSLLSVLGLAHLTNSSRPSSPLAGSVLPVAPAPSDGPLAPVEGFGLPLLPSATPAATPGEGLPPGAAAAVVHPPSTATVPARGLPPLPIRAPLASGSVVVLNAPTLVAAKPVGSTVQATAVEPAATPASTPSPVAPPPVSGGQVDPPPSTPSPTPSATPTPTPTPTPIPKPSPTTTPTPSPTTTPTPSPTPSPTKAAG